MSLCVPRLAGPALVVLAVFATMFASSVAADGDRYVCPPCGCSADGELFAEPGDCAGCGMARVLADAIDDVAIVVFDGVELLDFSGPGEVFAAAGGAGQGYRVFTVAASTDPVVSQGFLRITPSYDVESAPEPEIVVIPGGGIGRVLESQAMMDWIEKRAAAGGSEVVLSVCNGALVLARLGLLDGLEATTHHGSIDSLRQMAPDAKVHDDRRFVDNGRIVTAAGVSAGIDAALHVVARRAGVEHAERVARYMEYAWDPATTREHVAPDPEGLPLALTGLDPVLLAAGEEKAGQETRVATDDRYRYLFASDESHARFVENPERYAIQGRGSCAGMGAKIRARSGKAELYSVHDGYIYIFAGPNCRKDFLEDPELYIAEMNDASQLRWGEPVGPPQS